MRRKRKRKRINEEMRRFEEMGSRLTEKLALHARIPFPTLRFQDIQ